MTPHPLNNDRRPLVGLTLDGLTEIVKEAGMPVFTAKQMADWLYAKRVTTIDSMTNLSKAARERLSELYTVGRELPKAESRSKDGTVKYLFNGTGGRDIESVYIPDRERATLCVSSQAGCRMNCQFCMTGRNEIGRASCRERVY